METEDGVGLLLHVGIDTVTLNGEGFKVLVENGQKVKKGDVLMELDLDFLQKNAKSMTSPVIITDIDESKIDVSLIASGEVKAGDPLYAVTIYE
jgi:PTS system D-glucosamine-specific IIC component